METIWYSSFFLVFAFAVNALLSLLGCAFLYFYWYQEHLKIPQIAFAIYNIAMPDIGDLPRSWTNFVNTLNGGTGIGTITAIGNDSVFHRYAWCWYFVYITICFSLAAPISWQLWFQKHPDEKQHELDAINEKIEIENAIMGLEDEADNLATGGAYAAYADYSAPDYSAPQYPGACPPQSSDIYGGAFAGAGAYPPQSGAGYYPPQSGAGAYAPQSGADPYAPRPAVHYQQGAEAWGASPYGQGYAQGY
jgi:hypothetical protein